MGIKRMGVISIIITMALNIILGIPVNALETDVKNIETERTKTTALEVKRMICAEAIEGLERKGFVENAFERWSSTDYITRRDAFKLAYIFNQGKRKFVLKVDEMSEEELIDELQRVGCSWEPLGNFFEEYRRIFKFEDLERGTFDYEFAANLFYGNLFLGEEVEGKKYACFDEYMTYEQAFATVCRMFSGGLYYNSESWILRYYNDGEPVNPYAPDNYQSEINPYYQFCVDTGLINNYSNPLYQYTIDVTKEQLSDNITAYEYMYIINEALYISSSNLAEKYNGRKLVYFPIEVSADDDIVW